MQDTAILLPVMALVGWTLTVLLLLPIRRVRAVQSGLIKSDDFALGESARVPDQVRLANRHFMNLLEAPILFYVLCLLLFVTHHADQLALGLAWLYVGLRLLHSLVHLAYNQVMLRGLVFGISSFTLGVLWWITLLKLV